MTDSSATTSDPQHAFLNEIEQVEIASALSFHFDGQSDARAARDCREELKNQYLIMCTVVERMIRRRLGGVA